MDQKLRILIVDSQEDWLNILRQALSGDEFEVQAARTYDEAQCALEVASLKFSLAVVDPMVEERREEAEDAVAALGDLMQRFPDLPMIIVTGTTGQAKLETTNGLPRSAPLIQKQHWDRAEFTSLVQQILSGDEWGPPMPEITLPPDLEPNPLRVSPTEFVTGPLPSSGLTGPLPTGLIPPPVG